MAPTKTRSDQSRGSFRGVLEVRVEDVAQGNGMRKDQVAEPGTCRVEPPLALCEDSLLLVSLSCHPHNGLAMSTPFAIPRNAPAMLSNGRTRASDGIVRNSSERTGPGD